MAEGSKRTARVRLILVVVIFVGFLLTAKFSGVFDDISAESIRAQVDRAGAWGFVSYVAIFSGGEFIHIPGMVFVAAGILAYGKGVGFVLAFVGSVASVCFSFVVVRLIGGRSLKELDKAWVKKLLAKLDERPIRTVAVLRLFLWLLPALNYTLALTNISFRDYLVGSAVGLILPLAGTSLLFDWVFTRFL
jgi:uncharacterized membrane protein YdjX (TVP38/TMEM64 family)